MSAFCCREQFIFRSIANLEIQIVFKIWWQIGAVKYSNIQIKWNAVYFLNIDTILVNGNESARFSNCDWACLTETKVIDAKVHAVFCIFSRSHGGPRGRWGHMLGLHTSSIRNGSKTGSSYAAHMPRIFREKAIKYHFWKIIFNFETKTKTCFTFSWVFSLFSVAQ